MKNLEIQNQQTKPGNKGEDVLEEGVTEELKTVDNIHSRGNKPFQDGNVASLLSTVSLDSKDKTPDTTQKTFTKEQIEKAIENFNHSLFALDKYNKNSGQSLLVARSQINNIINEFKKELFIENVTVKRWIKKVKIK